MSIITAELLSDAGACKEQVKTFKWHWPTGAAITVENITEARRLDLNIEWLIVLLTDAALDEFEHVREAAMADFEHVSLWRLRWTDMLFRIS